MAKTYVIRIESERAFNAARKAGNLYGDFQTHWVLPSKQAKMKLSKSWF